MATKSKAKKATKAPAKKIATKKQFPPAHPPEVKAKAIQRARELHSAAKAAAELKLPPKTVEGWLTVANKKDKPEAASTATSRAGALKKPAKRADTPRAAARQAPLMAFAISPTQPGMASHRAPASSVLEAELRAKIAGLEAEVEALKAALRGR